MKYLIIYLLIINALGFLLMLTDKLKAKKRSRRIPEAALLGIGLIGGSLGCLLGMMLIRHKTKKPVFRSGLPAMVLLHCIVFYYIFRLLI